MWSLNSRDQLAFQGGSELKLSVYVCSCSVSICLSPWSKQISHWKRTKPFHNRQDEVMKSWNHLKMEFSALKILNFEDVSMGIRSFWLKTCCFWMFILDMLFQVIRLAIAFMTQLAHIIFFFGMNNHMSFELVIVAKSFGTDSTLRAQGSCWSLHKRVLK